MFFFLFFVFVLFEVKRVSKNTKQVSQVNKFVNLIHQPQISLRTVEKLEYEVKQGPRMELFSKP